MAGWLVKSLRFLTAVTVAGIIGGSIGHLTNKVQPQKQEETKEKAIISEKREIIKVPKDAKICKWLGIKGYSAMKNKAESACKRFAENKLNVEFKFLNKFNNYL